jgi:hypothetical protein
MYRYFQDMAMAKLFVLFLVLLYALGETGTKAWGFNKRWRWFLHGIVAVLVMGAVIADFIRGEGIPGSVVRGFVFALLVYELSIGTLSFLLAGLLALPG